MSLNNRKEAEMDVATQKQNTLLNELKPGETAKICGFLADGPEIMRLKELGVCKGTRLRLVRFAPFGDPVEIKLRGYHLSISKSLARLIQIEQEVEWQ